MYLRHYAISAPYNVLECHSEKVVLKVAEEVVVVVLIEL